MDSTTWTKDRIVIATRNAGKLKEFQTALQTDDRQVVSLLDYPAIEDIVEDGDTFSANSHKKAKETAEQLQVQVLADDSGLCVERLDGAPGVYSARYSGEGATDTKNNEKLIEELLKLESVWTPDAVVKLPTGRKLLSRAYFICVLTLYDPQTDCFIEAEGKVEGYIMDKPLGDGGFGYDPLFWLPQLEKSMAQLTREEKQKISHRGEALRVLHTTLHTVE